MGGPVIIGGCILVTISAYKRTQATPVAQPANTFDDESMTNANELQQSTNKLLDDVNMTSANEPNKEKKVRQTTKYEKLREANDETELSVIVNDNIPKENENI